MKQIALVFLSILSAFCLLNLSRERTFINAKTAIAHASTSNDSLELYSENLARLVKSTSQGMLASNAGKKLAINYLVELANNLTNTNDRLKVYCEAFRIADDLKNDSPKDAKILVNWLNWQQILESTDCSTKLTSDEKTKLIETASKNSPTDTDVAYALALLHVWDNKRHDALPLFSKVLRISNRITSGQEENIVDNLKSKEDITITIPARFPQIVRWSNLISKKKPDLYKASLLELEKLQLEAINYSTALKLENKISGKLHLSNLFALQAVTATDTIRKNLDNSISLLIGTESPLGKYLTERTKLNKINIIRSSINHDSLPFKNSFSVWDSQKVIYLDNAHNTIGFLKKMPVKTKMIELHSVSNTAQLQPSSFQILVSMDNQSWSEVEAKMTLIKNSNWSGSYLVFEPISSDYKYLKVNFKDPRRNNSFWNYENLLINVYG